MRRDAQAEFEAEVLRLHARYVTEVVERFDICPFARHAQRAGKVKNVVLSTPTLDLAATMTAVDALVAGPPDIEVAQLIFPRVSVRPRELEWFSNDVPIADTERRPGRPIFVLAAFHPRYPLDPSSPERLVPFLRRSPDPTLQLLRFARIEQLRNGEEHGTAFVDFATFKLEDLAVTSPPTLTERIARDNHAMLARVGPHEIETILADIQADRARSYSRFEESAEPVAGSG